MTTPPAGTALAPPAGVAGWRPLASEILGNYALDLAIGICDIGGGQEAAMNIDLTNPIFHNEIKATAHMEADRWPMA